jgi:exosortase E/protease (VPEID-CTERM system)
MNQSSVAVTEVPRFQFGLAARLGVIAVVFLVEKTLLNRFIDFHRPLARLGLDGFARLVHYQGMPFVVVFAAAAALFAYKRGAERFKPVDAEVRAARPRVSWILAHVCIAASLVPLSHYLYRFGVTPELFVAFVALWAALGLGAVASAFLAMAPWPRWLELSRVLGPVWYYAALIGLLSSAAIVVSQGLWETATAVTFGLVRLLLSPIFPTLYVNPALRELGTNNFTIAIEGDCSGLEGIGLISAFTIAWLFYLRREYRFPHALLLIPLGAAIIFVLNTVRIAALLLIGNAGYAEIAAYGFHSQAGWIAFIAASCGIAVGSQKVSWFYRPAPKAAVVTTDNAAAAFLTPFIVLLGVGILSRALSGRFEMLYPLRLVAGGVALWLCRPRLVALNWHWSWRGTVAGVAVFCLWMLSAHYLLPLRDIPAQLTSLPPVGRWLWIGSRVVTASLIVPIVEELAYRGYLMRRLTDQQFAAVPFERVRYPALIITSVLFGLGHGTLWLSGTAAGLVFGWIAIRRGSIGEAVAAHVTSNVLIAACVLGFGQWQLW